MRAAKRSALPFCALFPFRWPVLIAAIHSVRVPNLVSATISAARNMIQRAQLMVGEVFARLLSYTIPRRGYAPVPAA